MIRYNKGPEPPILAQRRARYLPRILAALADGDLLKARKLTYRYKHGTIREQLLTDSYGKCVYCESRVRHLYPGDVEHIRPKSLFPDLAYSWENLGYSCWECNNHKRKQHDPENPVLNAYTDNPDVYLVADGPNILPRGGSGRGATTIRLAALQRAPLWARRAERLEETSKLISVAKVLPADRANEVCEILRTRAGNDQEWSFVVAALLRQAGILKEP